MDLFQLLIRRQILDLGLKNNRSPSFGLQDTQIRLKEKCRLKWGKNKGKRYTEQLETKNARVATIISCRELKAKNIINFKECVFYYSKGQPLKSITKMLLCGWGTKILQAAKCSQKQKRYKHI